MRLIGVNVWCLKGADVLHYWNQEAKRVRIALPATEEVISWEEERVSFMETTGGSE